jgi:TrmH family RNA methyltransferase
VITSTKNRHVAVAARLKKRGLREQHRRFLAEGAQAAGEALAAGAAERVFHLPGSGGRVATVVAQADAEGVEVTAVSDAVMAHLTSAVTPQGVVAVARFVDVPMEALPADPGLVPVLCAVRDPGNAGTILRSADAAGASSVVFTAESVDVYNSKTVRASAGSLFHLPVARDVPAEDAVAALRDSGVQILAADAEGESSVYDVDLTGPTAVLFGNEAWGLTSEVRRLAERTVRVPIVGRAESLNLAAAAALILFEAARQRAAGATGEPDVASVVSAAAHDLRLPLTALKGFASTLVERWEMFEDPDRRQMVQGLGLDSERIGGMITMVVDLARLESGRFRHDPVRVELAEAGGWVADLFRRGPDYPDVEIRGRARASADVDRLRAVLLALCDGALWWGREGPVLIEVAEGPGGPTVEVARTGGGPAPEELEAMFSGPGVPGAKMALHLAHRLAAAQGWSLEAGAEDGVRFVLTLPKG